VVSWKWPLEICVCRAFQLLVLVSDLREHRLSSRPPFFSFLFFSFLFFSFLSFLTSTRSSLFDQFRHSVTHSIKHLNTILQSYKHGFHNRFRAAIPRTRYALHTRQALRMCPTSETQPVEQRLPTLRNTYASNITHQDNLHNCQIRDRLA
jgi:hypothetical protein